MDVVFEKDVAVTLRDGVTIRVDVFRPVGDEPVPVIVAWSPYGKGQGTSASVKGVFALVGLDDGIVSGLEKFEGPDPAYWCAQGYAVCNPDIRGVVDSEGDSVLWDRQEGRDCSDVIEWLAEQSWCSGKVGMSGTSYLAVSQWFTAAEQPPHLAAINPWEGVSDVYRDLVMRGGMPDTGFAEQLQDGSFFGKNRKEDILSEAGATAINLVEFTDPRTDTDNGPYHPMNHAGLTRLALLVDDVDEAFEAIASRDGVQIVCSPREIGIHQGQDTHRSRWFSFRDPFGVFITATQSDQPEAKDDQDG